MNWVLPVVVLGVNVLTFLAFVVDKGRARRGARRIPERVLIGLSALGGAPGGWVAMTLVRHKTSKVSFQVRMVAATALTGLWVWLWWRSRG